MKMEEGKEGGREKTDKKGKEKVIREGRGREGEAGRENEVGREGRGRVKLGGGKREGG